MRPLHLDSSRSPRESKLGAPRPARSRSRTPAFARSTARSLSPETDDAARSSAALSELAFDDAGRVASDMRFRSMALPRIVAPVPSGTHWTSSGTTLKSTASTRGKGRGFALRSSTRAHSSNATRRSSSLRKGRSLRVLGLSLIIVASCAPRLQTVIRESRSTPMATRIRSCSGGSSLPSSTDAPSSYSWSGE